MAEVAKVSPTQKRVAILRNKVEALYGDIVNLRETYVFDNMIRASDFHAVVAPAIADSRIWLSDFLIFLLIRQRKLRQREAKNLEALRDAKQNLQESEELYRRLVAMMPDVVIRLDMDGNILYINDVALQIIC